MDIIAAAKCGSFPDNVDWTHLSVGGGIAVSVLAICIAWVVIITLIRRIF